jgi:CheY-like chemotaxis protein
LSLPADTILAEVSSAARSRSILVIDDSALIREAAKIALDTIGGWRILTASCGAEGIELAGSDRFDAILLDVEMPGMDGIAVAERLHELPATSALPIVLLTAHDRRVESERFRRAPVAGVIQKPFQLSDLAQQVADILGWWA